MVVPLPAASQPSKRTTVGTSAFRRWYCNRRKRSLRSGNTAWYSERVSERSRSRVSSTRGLQGGGRLSVGEGYTSAVILSEVTAVLSRTPGTLRALLDGVPEPWLLASEGPGTFSPRDVLGHLILGEETDWVPRIKIILESGDRQPFVPFDRFGFEDRIEGVSTSALLDELASLRARNLEYLEGLALGPAQLGLPGRHPELGAVTLGQLLATWVVHDLNHVHQIVRVMSNRYRDAVGPWK